MLSAANYGNTGFGHHRIGEPIEPAHAPSRMPLTGARTDSALEATAIPGTQAQIDADFELAVALQRQEIEHATRDVRHSKTGQLLFNKESLESAVRHAERIISSRSSQSSPRLSPVASRDQSPAFSRANPLSHAVTPRESQECYANTALQLLAVSSSAVKTKIDTANQELADLTAKFLSRDIELTNAEHARFVELRQTEVMRQALNDLILALESGNNTQANDIKHYIIRMAGFSAHRQSDTAEFLNAVLQGSGISLITPIPRPEGEDEPELARHIGESSMAIVIDDHENAAAAMHYHLQATGTYPDIVPMATRGSFQDAAANITVLDSAGQEHHYSLAGAAFHNGVTTRSSSSGHYTAVVKEEGQFFHVDDSHVAATSLRDANGARIAIYKRVDAAAAQSTLL